MRIHSTERRWIGRQVHFRTCIIGQKFKCSSVCIEMGKGDLVGERAGRIVQPYGRMARPSICLRRIILAFLFSSSGVFVMKDIYRDECRLWRHPELLDLLARSRQMDLVGGVYPVVKGVVAELSVYVEDSCSISNRSLSGVSNHAIVR